MCSCQTDGQTYGRTDRQTYRFSEKLAIQWQETTRGLIFLNALPFSFDKVITRVKKTLIPIHGTI